MDRESRSIHVSSVVCSSIGSISINHNLHNIRHIHPLHLPITIPPVVGIISPIGVKYNPHYSVIWSRQKVAEAACTSCAQQALAPVQVQVRLWEVLWVSLLAALSAVVPI